MQLAGDGTRPAAARRRGGQLLRRRARQHEPSANRPGVAPRRDHRLRLVARGRRCRGPRAGGEYLRPLLSPLPPLSSPCPLREPEALPHSSPAARRQRSTRHQKPRSQLFGRAGRASRRSITRSNATRLTTARRRRVPVRVNSVTRHQVEEATRAKCAGLFPSGPPPTSKIVGVRAGVARVRRPPGPLNTRPRLAVAFQSDFTTRAKQSGVSPAARFLSSFLCPAVFLSVARLFEFDRRPPGRHVIVDRPRTHFARPRFVVFARREPDRPSQRRRRRGDHEEARLTQRRNRLERSG